MTERLFSGLNGSYLHEYSVTSDDNGGFNVTDYREDGYVIYYHIRHYVMPNTFDEVVKAIVWYVSNLKKFTVRFRNPYGCFNRTIYATDFAIAKELAIQQKEADWEYICILEAYYMYNGGIKMNGIFTQDSFGEYCPTNWQEIADWLNGTYESVIAHDPDSYETDEDKRELAENIWNDYCLGYLEHAPEAVF